MCNVHQGTSGGLKPFAYFSFCSMFVPSQLDRRNMANAYRGKIYCVKLVNWLVFYILCPHYLNLSRFYSWVHTQ